MVTNGLAGAIKHNIVLMTDRVAGNMTPVGADVEDQPVADIMDPLAPRTNLPPTSWTRSRRTR